MPSTPKWQQLGRRKWEELQGAWLAHIPSFQRVGEPPNPGLERLPSLLEKPPPTEWTRLPDVDGLRTNALWEAVFLFHKCSHTNLAAQRLGRQGMHSWCLFNGYHSAYLGARGIMALLGVTSPNLSGPQVLIDLYPEPEPPKKRSTRGLASPQFQEYFIVQLPHFDQRHLWDAFQRLLRMSNVACWDTQLCRNLLNLSPDEITPPRNRFLYKAHYWPLNDLTSDATPAALMSLVDSQPDPDAEGFLLQLSFSVYRLFEQLLTSLGNYSEVIKQQVSGSRFLTDLELKLPELECYKEFLSRRNIQAESSR